MSKRLVKHERSSTDVEEGETSDTESEEPVPKVPSRKRTPPKHVRGKKSWTRKRRFTSIQKTRQFRLKLESMRKNALVSVLVEVRKAKPQMEAELYSIIKAVNAKSVEKQKHRRVYDFEMRRSSRQSILSPEHKRHKHRRSQTPTPGMLKTRSQIQIPPLTTSKSLAACSGDDERSSSKSRGRLRTRVGAKAKASQRRAKSVTFKRRVPKIKDRRKATTVDCCKKPVAKKKKVTRIGLSATPKLPPKSSPPKMKIASVIELKEKPLSLSPMSVPIMEAPLPPPKLAEQRSVTSVSAAKKFGGGVAAESGGERQSVLSRVTRTRARLRSRSTEGRAADLFPSKQRVRWALDLSISSSALSMMHQRSHSTPTSPSSDSNSSEDEEDYSDSSASSDSSGDDGGGGAKQSHYSSLSLSLPSIADSPTSEEKENPLEAAVSVMSSLEASGHRAKSAGGLSRKPRSITSREDRELDTLKLKISHKTGYLENFESSLSDATFELQTLHRRIEDSQVYDRTDPDSHFAGTGEFTSDLFKMSSKLREMFDKYESLLNLKSQSQLEAKDSSESETDDFDFNETASISSLEEMSAKRLEKKSSMKQRRATPLPVFMEDGDNLSNGSSDDDLRSVEIIVTPPTSGGSLRSQRSGIGGIDYHSVNWHLNPMWMKAVNGYVLSATNQLKRHRESVRIETEYVSTQTAPFCALIQKIEEHTKDTRERAVIHIDASSTSFAELRVEGDSSRSGSPTQQNATLILEKLFKFLGVDATIVEEKLLCRKRKTTPSSTTSSSASSTLSESSSKISVRSAKGSVLDSRLPEMLAQCKEFICSAEAHGVGSDADASSRLALMKERGKLLDELKHECLELDKATEEHLVALSEFHSLTATDL